MVQVKGLKGQVKVRFRVWIKSLGIRLGLRFMFRVTVERLGFRFIARVARLGFKGK